MMNRHSIIGDLVTDQNTGVTSVHTGNGFSSIQPSYDIALTRSDVSKMVFKTDNIDITVECLMCSHFEKIDMRKEAIVNQAKSKLKE